MYIFILVIMSDILIVKEDGEMSVDIYIDAFVADEEYMQNAKNLLNEINSFKSATFQTPELMRIYCSFPTLGWNIKILHANYNYLSNMLVKRKGKSKEDLKTIFSNPYFPIDYVPLRYINCVGHNKQLTIEYILKHVNDNLNWNHVSQNSTIKLEDIEQHFYLPWRLEYLSRNKNMTFKFVSEHLERRYFIDETKFIAVKPDNSISFLFNLIDKWDWVKLAANPGITSEDIINNPTFPWDHWYFTLNPNCFDYIKQHPEINWDYSDLDFNEKLTIEYVLEHPERKWDWRYVSANPGIGLPDIINHPELPWNWKWISRNPNMNIQFILANKGKKWNWVELSANSGITMHDVEANPKLAWSWTGLSRNPNLTCEFMLKHPNAKWNAHLIEQNKFQYDERLNCKREICYI